MMPNELKKWLNDCIETARSKNMTEAEIIFAFTEVLRELALKSVIEKLKLPKTEHS
ncbi:MAG: hypothetical protein PHW43_09945 [Syntrophales bacterium]|jgi:hypothetical protein|nr:hypothetical protein [Syntrophales bacterium]